MPKNEIIPSAGGNMKNLVIFFLAGLSLFGCSNSDGGKKATPREPTFFEKTASGEWDSECIQEQDQFFKEYLVILNNGTGTRQFRFFQYNSCQGNPARIADKVSFTYTSLPAKTDGFSEVIVKEAGKADIKYDVKIEASKMILKTQQRTILYQKAGTTPPGNGGSPNNPKPEEPKPQEPKPQDPTAPGKSIEQVVVGQWKTQCTRMENGSYVVILDIRANGLASQSGLYWTEILDCSGEGKALSVQEFTYVVKNFTNEKAVLTMKSTQGQIQDSDVLVEGNSLTVKSDNQTIVYKKVQ